MVRSLRPLVVISLAAAAATTAVVALPDATAQSSAVPQAQAPQLVGGLPDFTQLVERVGPAVVNIEADVKPRRAMAQQQMPDDEEIPEIFRRFFGPGMPGMPSPGPRGGGTSDRKSVV